jgi:hypothetical protein
MRPAVADLSVDFGGRQVYDVEPRTLPNLYHGMPVRMYGRYRGDGDLKVTVAGTVQGVPLVSTADVSLPEVNDANPEIERMWAWHRVDRLQKEADRSGTRERVLDEIVRLGETYSIVTEYTSFLVLENDGEYQRWKIERRNADRIGRDRKALEARRDELAALRTRAAADIGPLEPAPAVETVPASPPSRARPSFNAPAPRQNGQATGFDLDIGTGPVGPLFVVLAGWMVRRKRNAA